MPGAFLSWIRPGHAEICAPLLQMRQRANPMLLQMRRNGQDVSIGYAGHSDAVVRLYLQETFTFRVLTTEAAVAIAPALSV